MDGDHYPATTTDDGGEQVNRTLFFGWPTWPEVAPLTAQPPPVDRAYLARQVAEVHAGAVHRGGVRWDDAPLPPVWHLCRWQTRVGTRSATQDVTERCACGAARAVGTRRGPWTGRNCRRWGTVEPASRWRRWLARWGKMTT